MQIFFREFEKDVSNEEILFLLNFLNKNKNRIFDFSNFTETFTRKNIETTSDNKIKNQLESYRKISSDKDDNFFEINEGNYIYIRDKFNEEKKQSMSKTSKKVTKENKKKIMKPEKILKLDKIEDKAFCYFQNIVQLGRKIETFKQNLAMIPEFNFIAAFESLLLNKNVDYLTLEDFKVSLDYPKKDLIHLFENYSASFDKSIMM